MNRGKIKFGSLGLALLVVIVLVVWMASGDVKVASDETPERETVGEEKPPRVQVQILQSDSFAPSMMIQGQVEPWRSASIDARVDGAIEELPVAQGDQVAKGDSLIRLSDDDRAGNILRAQARVRQIEAELAATDRLRADNLVSQTEKLRLESELAGARAELEAAQLASRHLRPRAPFDGVVNRRYVELGEYVQPGQALLELVQVERLKVTGFAPQQSVTNLAPGQEVTLELLDGRSLEGRVSFIASAADEETRSFRVEVEVANPDNWRVAGASATIKIHLPERPAVFLSPAYLKLGDDGRLGVHHVDDQDRVQFAEVELLSATTEGAWVAGLPDGVRLITLGGGFVSLGARVDPVPEDS
ncbi:efflux RND transporter periplasmic adaptor subunit [Marinobacter salicampi]|uniref:efflux RND transporter periplasmic adaptor subunit n=1 Tax=Marinobacter salicampi TaxID=435907 RepID=UPI001F5ECED0|nr:efflux RND transporter periplasmic adaptor subunit [Marinobacter salicampi]